MKKIKVLQIMPLCDFGGVESHRYITAKYNDKEKIDMIFCCLGGQGYTSNKIEDLGYKVYCLDQSITIPNFMLVYKLYKLINNINPDIVHTSSAEANFHGMIASILAGVKVRIAEEVGIPSQSKKAKVIFHWIYKLSSKVIGVSQKVIDFLIFDNKLDSGKTILIYNPFDIDKFKNDNNKIDHDDFVIVTVGRLVKEKNHLFLIRSFLQVQKKYNNTKLLIIGDGPLKGEAEEFITKHQLNEQVLLLGFRENIPDYLLRSDLFILPSNTEGLPIALVEAMYVGIPTIGTRVGGIPEVIVENQSMGWIVPNNDVKSMAKTIEDAINLSKEEKNVITNNAKNYVEEKFSPHKYVDNLYKLYVDLIRETNS